MPKHLVISTSTELVRLMPDNIVYISSDGNYSIFTLIDRSEVVFSFNLQRSQDLIVGQLGEEARRFIRIGKSLIINRNYIMRINPAKQQLVLCDADMRNKFDISASKEALKQIKQLIEKEV